MKALKVFESLNFERGKDPIDVMDIGVKTWLHNFDTNYFKLSTEERSKASEQFNNIMSKIGIREIPVSTSHFPLEMIFGFKNERDYRQFKLDHDLYLTCWYGGYTDPRSGHITDEKGKPIASDSSTSAGEKGVETLLDRISKIKRTKFPKS